jgi:hypothetical protein
VSETFTCFGRKNLHHQITMNKFLLTLFVISSLVLSCKFEDKSSDKTALVDTKDSIFIVQQGPFHFSVKLPKDLVLVEMPILAYKENTGELWISVGHQFQLILTQEIRDLHGQKESMSTDPVFKTDITEEDSIGLIYHQKMKSGEHYSYHYMAMVRNTKLPYYARTSPTCQFNLQNVEMMRRAISSIQPLK